jgi:nicotinate-nucleotide adenylyltransferase
LLAPVEDRLAMLRLALDPEPAAEICDIELEPGGPSYTADTLDALQARYPEARLHFILGMDSLLELDSWRNPEAILARHAVVAVDRPGFDPSDLDPQIATRVRLVLGNPFAVSSTLVRRRVAAGLGVRHLVPAGVAGYLAGHALYGDESR